MRITVIGTGYVGLVTGTCFAESGNDVTCVDLDKSKIDALEKGIIPIYEPGLEELVKRNAEEKRLTFTTDLTKPVGESEVIFIAVGTPPGETGDADLRHVLAAAESIGKALKRPAIIVNKSTVPVGTCDQVTEVVRNVTQVQFEVVSNPEFLKEGSAIDDFMRPDRVVVGCTTENAKAVMNELYAPFVRTEAPLLFMDPRSSELTKYAANSMLATRISFMNDMAMLCERTGANIDDVRKGMGADKRIGYPFLFPGVGYGGSCFPKDVTALMTLARQVGLDFDLLRAVERINERQKKLLVDKALKHFGGNFVGKRFALWGLSFKPKTDDMREAPSLTVAAGLLGHGATVHAHDPVASEVASRILEGRVTMHDTPYEAAEGADALFLVTEWNEFRTPDFARIKSLMRTPVIFDGRNIYRAEQLRKLGFTYYGIGRP